jgi:nicotinamidase-related amidase
VGGGAVSETREGGFRFRFRFRVREGGRERKREREREKERKRKGKNLRSHFPPPFRTKNKKVMSDATGEASHAERVTSIDYRLSGFRIPPRSWDAQLIDELLLDGDADAGSGDPPSPNSSSALFLPKTSCNVFLSTALDFHLRSMGTKRLVVAGVVTDQCVATAVQTAADLGYLVTLAEDACAATSPERHEAALRTLRGFARVRSTGEVVAELGRAGTKKVASEMR